ncbi:MAG TPA: D-sedoheptulose 7-phosphate isomerase [Burkholderiales bacterium]|jgi:D-sedoheptulose 7-phosphate isomerase|nr:D-sedoheptulose 7-phosphate isomerase [Burkholderiales bacterium]
MDAFAEAATRRLGLSFSEHKAVLEQCHARLLPAIIAVGQRLMRSIQGGGKIMLCGNGGSAADAQHIAAELIGRFKKERRAFAALALTTDSSILTCIGNDYSFEDIFARQVAGMARAGDVLVAISTSGNSPNVLKAAGEARRAGCATVALGGRGGGKLAPLCDHSIVVPSDETPRIQEMHIMIGHMLCDLLEDC